MACFGTTAGNIYAANFIVSGTVHLPDYVFESDYNLKPIPDLETYINTNKHLPNVPSASDINQSGLNLSQMVPTLLEKTEENTLYIIGNYKAIQNLTAQYDQQNILTAAQTQNIASLQMQLQDSKDQLTILTGENSIYGITLTTDEKNIQKLQNDFENTNKILEELQGRMNDESSRITNGESRITKNETDITDLTAQMADLKNQNQTVIDFASALNVDKDTNTVDFGTWNVNVAGINAASINLTGDVNAKNVTVAETLKGNNLELGKDTTGKNVLKAGDIEVEIDSVAVNKDAKIYITPTGKLEGRNFYVDYSLINDNKSFTVKLDGDPLDKDVNFNWLIVK